MRGLTALVVATSIGCAASNAASRAEPSAPSSATTCTLEGEYVSGRVRVIGHGERVDATVGNVRAAVAIDANGVSVAVTEPLRFDGAGEGVSLYSLHPIDVGGAVQVDAAVPLGARTTIRGGRLRVDVPAVPELDLAIACDGLVAGVPARGRVPIYPPPVRTRISVDGEIALFAAQDLSGEQVGWLGTEGRESIVVGLLERVDRRVARIRIATDGIAVAVFVEARYVTALPPEEEVYPTPARANRVPSTGPITVLDVPSGTPVFATSVASDPWATTTLAMQVRSAETRDSRRDVQEFSVDVDSRTTPAPSSDHSRRVVLASYVTPPGEPYVVGNAAWVAPR